MEPLTVALARQIIEDANKVDLANQAIGASDVPQEIVSITVDLTTAKDIGRPMEINFPFRSVFVRSASDSSTEIKLRPNTVDQQQGDIPLRNNDSFVFPRQQNKCFLTWSAQSGKTVTLLFFVTGEFRSGSQVSSTAGGVSITDGDAVAVQTTATVSTAALLFAANTSRKKMQIINKSGLSIYLGDSAVTDDSGTKIGLEVPAGAQYAWENTSACYAVSQGGVSTGQKIGLVQFS